MYVTQEKPWENAGNLISARMWPPCINEMTSETNDCSRISLLRLPVEVFL